ncbi:unnamed protein product [Pedinophyceae sp. YPF-701]|nr:unnamed protein product [Pedinophyceae sp. YPF-701]
MAPPNGHGDSIFPYIAPGCPSDMVARPEDWNAERFKIVLPLGQGAKSKVMLAVDRLSWRQVALKKIKCRSLSSREAQQLEKEILIHGSITHKHLLALWGAFRDADNFYIVLEIADGGDLYRRSHRVQMKEAAIVNRVLRPLLEVVAFLHANNVIHRDIKPENIVFTQQGQLKLADLGLALDTSKDQGVSRVGTLEFMAPEVIMCGRITPVGITNEVLPLPGNEIPKEQRTPYDEKVDIWAVGCLAYEMFCHVTPFLHDKREATIARILEGRFTLPAKMPPKAGEFVTACLQVPPAQRPSAMELLASPLLALDRPREPVQTSAMEAGNARPGASTSDVELGIDVRAAKAAVSLAGTASLHGLHGNHQATSVPRAPKSEAMFGTAGPPASTSSVHRREVRESNSGAPMRLAMVSYSSSRFAPSEVQSHPGVSAIQSPHSASARQEQENPNGGQPAWKRFGAKLPGLHSDGKQHVNASDAGARTHQGQVQQRATTSPASGRPPQPSAILTPVCETTSAATKATLGLSTGGQTGEYTSGHQPVPAKPVDHAFRGELRGQVGGKKRSGICLCFGA